VLHLCMAMPNAAVCAWLFHLLGVVSYTTNPRLKLESSRTRCSFLDLQELEATVVDGNGTETGHIIATTIGGRNGQPKQVYLHLELCILVKSIWERYYGQRSAFLVILSTIWSSTFSILYWYWW
jgi:hypothetical protein